MGVLKSTIGLFSVVSLLTMTIVMLIVGVAGEGIKTAFKMIWNYKLPQLQYERLLRNFRSHSKPAYM